MFRPLVSPPNILLLFFVYLNPRGVISSNVRVDGEQRQGESIANKNITYTKLLLPCQLGELARCILFSFLIFSTVDIDVLGYIWIKIC